MVDKFVSYSEDVENVQEAFAFVMDHLDEFEAPNIQIQSYTVYENLSDMAEEDAEHEVRYGVSVSGTVT